MAWRDARVLGIWRFRSILGHNILGDERGLIFVTVASRWPRAARALRRCAETGDRWRPDADLEATPWAARGFVCTRLGGLSRLALYTQHRNFKVERVRIALNLEGRGRRTISAAALGELLFARSTRNMALKVDGASSPGPARSWRSRRPSWILALPVADLVDAAARPGQHIAGCTPSRSCGSVASRPRRWAPTRPTLCPPTNIDVH